MSKRPPYPLPTWGDLTCSGRKQIPTKSPPGPCCPHGGGDPPDQPEALLPQRPEDGGLALTQVAELLAGGLLQVALVAHDDGVLARRGGSGEELGQGPGTPLVLVG